VQRSHVTSIVISFFLHIVHLHTGYGSMFQCTNDCLWKFFFRKCCHVVAGTIVILPSLLTLLNVIMVQFEY